MRHLKCVPSLPVTEEEQSDETVGDKASVTGWQWI